MPGKRIRRWLWLALVGTLFGSQGAAAAAPREFVLGTGGGRGPAKGDGAKLGPPLGWKGHVVTHDGPEQLCLEMTLSCFTCVHPIHRDCLQPVNTRINFYNAYNSVCVRIDMLARINNGTGVAHVVVRAAMREEHFDRLETPNMPNVTVKNARVQQKDVIVLRALKCYTHLCNGCGPARPATAPLPLLPLLLLLPLAVAP